MSKIVDIFEVVKGSLWAVVYDGKSHDEFKTLFDQWQDTEYLEQFFEDNKNDLANGIYSHLSIEDAVKKTIDETSFFELKVLAAAKNSLSNPDAKITLEKAVFHSLHKEVYNNEYIESKAYGTKTNSWLRIYAIRLCEDVYVVSGGGIKLTKDMRPLHLQKELEKLKATKEYLKENFVINEDDLGYLELGDNEEE